MKRDALPCITTSQRGRHVATRWHRYASPLVLTAALGAAHCSSGGGDVQQFSRSGMSGGSGSSELAGQGGADGDAGVAGHDDANAKAGRAGSEGSAGGDGGVHGIEVTFNDVYEQFFRGLQCSACHQFIGGELSPKQLYEHLVNVPAERAPCAGRVRVVPGDPEGSLLWQKLTLAEPPCGAPMPSGLPLFGPAPTPAKLEVMRAWIAGGAKP